MANITKINLKGTEYFLTDAEAQSLIAQLRESTYNKTEVDSLISAIDNKIDGIDVSNYETVESAASKYQPKGDYLTQHQDISGLATKEEVAEAVAGVDVTEQLGEYAKKSELPSVDGLATTADLSGKVDKVDGKGLSTNDYTDEDKAKLAATPSFWVGTQAEYDAITNKDTKTFYYIVEE